MKQNKIMRSARPLKSKSTPYCFSTYTMDNEKEELYGV